MIDRAAVGRSYPSFTVPLTEDLSRGLDAVLGCNPPAMGLSWPPSPVWPAVAASRGTACLLNVWEDLGVDPLTVRLVAEDFLHHRAPVLDEELMGRVMVEDVHEHFEPDRGIEDQVDLLVEFTDRAGSAVASYRCSYRVPVAVTAARSEK